ncbi:hypothetical protein [Thiothrix winogradskyi]|uniref:Uncharacterized protein n=1 Tax=Thiothrix winogradskyi TaxID=96472 RepID=A0ABY3T077_9GAMM|nr:hypothetical protein [Thiothrix winogradskyi]UJS24813.1 hypothetical protein L2Y54_01890 [Thiothrix winogradskyi]
MTYQEFYTHIDCRFPYHDTAAWQQLIAQSLEIGGDVPFLVLHEICRLPTSVTLNIEQHLAMYAYWKTVFSHCVQDIVEPASLALIQRQLLSDADVIYIMEQLRAYSQQYSALQVALFACVDEQGVVDAKYEEIASEWQR